MAVPVHVVIPTHTTRHLHRTLLGYAHQAVPATSITVSCDTDDPRIGTLLEQVVAETGTPLTQVYRARHPEARRSQTRNNGIRSLLGRGLAEEDRLLIVDGDCIPAADLIARHAEHASRGEFVIGNYIPLDERTTSGIPSDAGMHAYLEANVAAEQLARLDRIHRKARRHQVLRRFHLTKAHKPKIVGSNTSFRAGSLLAINGFDEEYMEWGYEDDDLGKRLHRSGARSVIAVREARIYHQWHPTSARAAWQSGSVAERFHSRLPTRCERGIENPVPQHELRERSLS
ncbi:MAG: galactosyltransferase-related protein [Planctomycetota bacterium]|nr:galactosyltransferase-related protein [Planctomycetota bacterium]